MNAALINTLAKNATAIGIGVALILGAVYLIARRTITETADAAAGVLTGNNTLTEGTQYAGAGVLGTIGAATNAVSGGTFQAIGESIASWFSPDSGGSLLTYKVMFPNGAYGAVNGNTIDSDGYFVYQGTSAGYPKGTRWRIGINQAGVRVAVPA